MGAARDSFSGPNMRGVLDLALLPARARAANARLWATHRARIVKLARVVRDWEVVTRRDQDFYACMQSARELRSHEAWYASDEARRLLVGWARHARSEEQQAALRRLRRRLRATSGRN